MRKYFTGVAAALSLAAAVAQAAVQSPVGTQWDLVVGGSGQQGLAFITFYDDGTFSGYELLSTRARNASSGDKRGPYTDEGRTISATDTPTAKTNVYGFSSITGPWSYDERGQVIGHFVKEIGEDEDGNPIRTDAVSFAARVVSGKRFTMVASTRNGKLSYSGVPFRETPDFSGPWSATKIGNRQSFFEFYDMTSVTIDNPYADFYPDLGDYPGIYVSQEGQGAGYTTLGFMMISPRKKVALSFESTPWAGEESTLSATFGSWSVSRKGTRISAVGVEGTSVGTSSGSAITVKAFQAPPE